MPQSQLINLFSTPTNILEPVKKSVNNREEIRPMKPEAALSSR